MSEIQSQKRTRSELEAETEDPKRQKASLNHILSILDQDGEDEAAEAEDLSELLTSLEQELSGKGEPTSGEEEDGTVESLMRRLLEATDDELGIPTTADVGVREGGANLGMCDDGLLWELEDEAANYYTLLQSELFL